eukprot:TRINITY_DN11842_c0_g1_i1.p1 TRINITY_DN11842_c0_g1~~TRINITY_DN11842_c0_g1_i1.p1  ORF type:complete len:108 (-),score=28.28 TRINITY_DN11842_c0_g1_i1:96-419(-)
MESIQKIIEIDCDKDGMKEFAIIELQGTLELENTNEFQKMKIGNISLNNGKAVLIIGNHKLNGTLSNLDKPLAVMKKMKKDKISYNILGLIKQKYVFNTRPSLHFNN